MPLTHSSEPMSSCRNAHAIGYPTLITSKRHTQASNHPSTPWPRTTTRRLSARETHPFVSEKQHPSVSEKQHPPRSEKQHPAPSLKQHPGSPLIASHLSSSLLLPTLIGLVLWYPRSCGRNAASSPLTEPAGLLDPGGVTAGAAVDAGVDAVASYGGGRSSRSWSSPSRVNRHVLPLLEIRHLRHADPIPLPRIHNISFLLLKDLFLAW